MRLVFVSTSALLLLTACPGDDGSPGGDAGSSGGVAATTSGDASATSMGATSMGPTGPGEDSTASGGSDDGSGCPAFEDEVPPSAITLEITNMLGEGVWLPMSLECTNAVPFVLTGPDDQEVPWRPPACGTCQGAVQGQCPCPPPVCDEVTGLYIASGATVEYVWAGLTHVMQTVPEVCPGIAECGPTCQLGVIPDDGTYTFSVQTGRAMGCATDPCECMPQDGSCTLFDPGMTFGTLTTWMGTVDLPGGTTAQILLQ